MLQVALNPLLSNVVREERLTSALTLGQLIKAVASFLGPVIAVTAASWLGSWKMIFPVFAGVTGLTTAWLALTPIRKDERTVVGLPSGGTDLFLAGLFCGS